LHASLVSSVPAINGAFFYQAAAADPHRSVEPATFVACGANGSEIDRISIN
jgi:hypothetical protein